MVVEYNLKVDNDTIKCVDFDGFIDQLSYIKDFIKNDIFNTATEVNECDDFYGEHTLSQTIEGMNYGFQNVTDYFLDIIEDVKSSTDISNGMFMDCEGFAYDMGAVVNGEPECCINYGLPKPTPCIKILVDIVFPCTYQSYQILNRGIAITTLIETLLVNGYIVDLYSFEFNNQYDIRIMYTNKIDTRTLSISNIAFMSSPEYFRKIGFITVDKIRNRPSGLGRGNSRILDFMINKIKKDKIFFIGGGYSDNELYNHLDSPQNALKYMLEKFNLYAQENKIEINFKTNDIDNKNL